MGKGSRAVWQELVLSLALLLAVALLLPASAEAAKSKPRENDGPPMRFAVVRSASPGCEPLCPEWISAEGTITRSTPAEFKKLLKKLGDKRLPVIVTSPGGHVEAAWELGRMLRARKLDIGVGLTRFVECAPGQKGCKLDPARKGIYSGVLYSSGAYCASACSMMFAGGVRRYVGQWAYMGVHQVTSYVTQQKITYRETYRVVNGKKKTVNRKVVGRKTVGSYSTTKMGKAFKSQMLAYLKEMGVKEAMFDAGQSTPAADMRQLALVEMLNMNLVTSMDAAGALVSIDICRIESPAANCVLAPGLRIASKSYPKPLVPEEPGMWLTVVRSVEAGCEPDCPEWISAEGQVDENVPQRLEALLKELGDRKLPLVISSSSGDPIAAMLMGRVVRANGLDVALGRTFFTGCKPRSKACAGSPGVGRPYLGIAGAGGAECGESCLLILSAGKTRLIGEGVVAGWGANPDLHPTIRNYYLVQMGVGPKVADAAPDFGRLDEVALARLREGYLTTRSGSVQILVDGGLCRTSPKPANCRALP